MKAFGRRPGQKAHFLQLSAKNVPWRFPPRSGQHAKAMATGTLSEGPWFRLNTETGTAPEKGQSRTSRAGANASLPVIPSVKAPPVELPAFFRPFLRDKKGQTAFLERSRTGMCSVQRGSSRPKGAALLASAKRVPRNSPSPYAKRPFDVRSPPQGDVRCSVISYFWANQFSALCEISPYPSFFCSF